MFDTKYCFCLKLSEVPENAGGGGGGGSPPHVRDFVKEGYFFVPRYEVWAVKIPLQSTKYTRL